MKEILSATPRAVFQRMRAIGMILMACCGVVMTVAQEPPVSILGTWYGEFSKMLFDKNGAVSISPGYNTWVVNNVTEDGFVYATAYWGTGSNITASINTHSDTGSPDHDDVVTGGSQETFGVMDFDNKGFTLMESAEPGMYNVKIIDNDTLHFKYTEHVFDSPYGAIFRAKLKRA